MVEQVLISKSFLVKRHIIAKNNEHNEISLEYNK